MKRIVFIAFSCVVLSCAFEEPYFMTIDIDNCGDRALVEGSFVVLSEESLKAEIYLKTKDLDSLQRSKFYVKLSISPNARMKDVSLVESEIRKANVMKIKYYNIEDVVCGGM